MYLKLFDITWIGEFEVKDKHYEEDVLEDEEEPLDDEEIEDDYEIYDEDEDEDLLRRLDAKYGKLDRGQLLKIADSCGT